MSASFAYSSLADAKDLKDERNTRIVVRNPNIHRIESYLDQLGLQATTSEKILASVVSMINALGNAELPSSFLWFMTTDVGEVGLDMTDLTISKQPVAARLAFYGTMAVTLMISGVGTRLFYVNDVKGVEERLNSVVQEEQHQETYTRELLFETLRYRSLVSDAKAFKEISNKLPKGLLKDFFLQEIETLYSKFLGQDSKDQDPVLKEKLRDSDFAFDEDFRHEVIKKIFKELDIKSASKYFFNRPVVTGDVSKATTEGTMGGLLMSGTLFPAWWAVYSLLVEMEIYTETSLQAFWGTAVSLIVLGLGVGFFMGKQENKNSKREALAAELQDRNKDLQSAIKTICQLNLKICQGKKMLPAMGLANLDHGDQKSDADKNDRKSGPSDATKLVKLGLHAVPPTLRLDDRVKVGAKMRRKSF